MRVSNMTRMMVMTLTMTVAGITGTTLAMAEDQQPLQEKTPVMQLDTKPGPAHETIFGTVSKIDGEVYTVQQPAANDYVASGMKADEVKVYVSKETKKLGGDKKVGDRIRAEVTRGGFANSIQ